MSSLVLSWLVGAAALAAPAWQVTGGVADARLGSTVAGAGDLDGDGWPDVLVTDRSGADAVAYLGSAAGLPALPSWQVTGASGAAAVGDVDGDGFDDVLVGVSGDDTAATDAGLVALYLGSPAGPATVRAWEAMGSAQRANFGAALASADLNGDGFADLVVGAPGAHTVSVFYGSATGPSSTPDVVLASGRRYGRRIASAGDVNADGSDDLLLLDDLTGAAKLFLGSATGVALAASWVGGTAVAAMASAGDVNGDGFGDVVLGEPDFSGLVGAAEVYHGSATGLGAQAAWRVSGSGSLEKVGTAVAGVGDLDGDGYDDVAVDSPGNPSGVITIHLGGAGGLSSRPLLRFGTSTTVSFGGAGDVDRDGLDDLLVGDPYADDVYGNEGLVELFLGHRLPDTDGDAVADPVDLCPTVSDPAQADVDHDGIGNACDTPDLWLDTAPSSGGTVHLSASAAPGEQVVFSAANGSGGVGPCPAALGGLCLGLGPAAVPLGVATADATEVAVLTVVVPATIVPGGPYALQAAVARGPGGAQSVASEVRVLDGDDLDWDGDGLFDADELVYGTDPRDPDTDGDGADDAIEVADPHLDPLVGDSDGDGVLDGLDLCSAGNDADDADADGLPDRCDDCPSVANPLQLDTDRDGLGNACETGLLTSLWVMEGGASSEQLGQTFGSAGDVNGDGFDDLLVGAVVDYTTTGRVDLYYGSVAGPVGPVWSVAGGAPGDEQFYAAGAGDVNGDGYDDIVIGAPGDDTGGAELGAVRLYEGSAAGPAAAPDWTAVGDQAGASFGLAESAGDVNGDGYGDLVVMVPTESHGQPWEGQVQVYLGSSTGLGLVADWTAESNQRHGGVTDLDDGREDVTAAADVNGDGYTDLVVGAAGAAVEYDGGPTGLSATPSWIRSGWSSDVTAVASAGDVDGDGYDDVLVGTPYAGRAWLFRGSPAGLEAVAAWDTSFGTAEYLSERGGDLASAGDVNGDGYGDVVVGELAWYDHDPEDPQGQVRVYLGSPSGLSPNPVWSENGPIIGGYEPPILEGWDVDGADVNGDGLSEVLYSAPLAGRSIPDGYYTGRLKVWTPSP